MIPIKHYLCNDILLRPPGTTEDECSDLPILRHPGGIISFWRPDEAEIQALNSGQPVVLKSSSSTHPPLSIFALQPLEETETEASERIKTIADSYISACFPGEVPPRQAIEIRLALYAGMMAMMRENSDIIARLGHDEDAAVKELTQVRAALIERASRLNQERTK